jgi:hypothetical protein
MRTTKADEYLGSPSLTDVSGAKQSKMKIKNQFHSFEMNGIPKNADHSSQFKKSMEHCGCRLPQKFLCRLGVSDQGRIDISCSFTMTESNRNCRPGNLPGGRRGLALLRCIT